MTDDVVENPKIGTDLKYVPGLDVDIVQACYAPISPPAAPTCREEKSILDELAPGQTDSHGDQAAAVRAAQLEHAATIHRRRMQTGERRHHGEVPWMTRRIRKVGVRNVVIIGSRCQVAHGITQQMRGVRALACPVLLGDISLDSTNNPVDKNDVHRPIDYSLCPDVLRV